MCTYFSQHPTHIRGDLHGDAVDIYYISFPKDRWIPKCLVYGVYLIDIAQTCLVTNDVFNAYAKHYGQLDFLAGIQNEWLAVPVLSGISKKSCYIIYPSSCLIGYPAPVSCAVQIYYAYRIRILSGSRWLQLLITAVRLLAVLFSYVIKVLPELTACVDSRHRCYSRRCSGVYSRDLSSAADDCHRQLWCASLSRHLHSYK